MKITRQGRKNAYLFAKMASIQITDIALNDHCKLDTVVASNRSEIVLDTTTPYTRVLNVASIGRIKLLKGHVYDCIGTLHALQTGSNTNVQFAWRNASNGTVLGSAGRLITTNANLGQVSFGLCVTAIDLRGATNDMMIELALISIDGTLTGIGTGVYALPWVSIKEVF